MECWKFLKCEHIKGGVREHEFGPCPAYPNHGRHCARVSSTLCGGQIQGNFALKLYDCLRCDYYKSDHYDKSYSGFSKPKTAY